MSFQSQSAVHNTPRILVVCMGNICRSPTGEAILRAKAAERGIDVEIDSAGTIGYHTGSKPDPRSQQAGEARGYSFAGIRSRQVAVEDFETFDLVLAADKANLADLIDICPLSTDTKCLCSSLMAMSPLMRSLILTLVEAVDLSVCWI